MEVTYLAACNSIAPYVAAIIFQSILENSPQRSPKHDAAYSLINGGDAVFREMCSGGFRTTYMFLHLGQSILFCFTQNRIPSSIVSVSLLDVSE